MIFNNKCYTDYWLIQSFCDSKSEPILYYLKSDSLISSGSYICHNELFCQGQFKEHGKLLLFLFFKPEDDLLSREDGGVLFSILVMQTLWLFSHFVSSKTTCKRSIRSFNSNGIVNKIWATVTSRLRRPVT